MIKMMERIKSRARDNIMSDTSYGDRYNSSGARFERLIGEREREREKRAHKKQVDSDRWWC